MFMYQLIVMCGHFILRQPDEISCFGLFSASSMLVRSLTQVWRLSLDQTNL